MSEKKSAVGASPISRPQPTKPNPLDIVPDKIPFDVTYGPPISLERAQAAISAVVAEAKKRDWKMNVAVVTPAETSLPSNVWMARSLLQFESPSTRRERRGFIGFLLSGIHWFVRARFGCAVPRLGSSAQ